MQAIEVEIKTVYGNQQIYPVNDAARAFAAIAGTKTLTAQAVQHIKTLGFSVHVKQTTPATL